jgi:hypothetical protein
MKCSYVQKGTDTIKHYVQKGTDTVKHYVQKETGTIKHYVQKETGTVKHYVQKETGTVKHYVQKETGQAFHFGEITRLAELCSVTFILGRAMAQAVSRQPLTAEARLRSRVGPCGICGGQSGSGTGFSRSTSVFPCHFHSTGAPLKWKSRKNLIIFITGLHNKPSRLRCVRSICCGALQ